MGAADAIRWAGPLLALATLAGLVARRRLGVCYAFAPYLGAILLSDLLMALWPHRFYWQWFWVGKELVITLLRFAVALELAYHTFRAFPGALAAARAVIRAVLLVTLVVVLAGTGSSEAPVSDTPLSPFIVELQPRILNGAIWLFTAIAALVLWYRLPVHPFHKAILTGLVPYLLIFTVSLKLIESHGWAINARVNYLHSAAFVLLLAYWTYAAWRRSEAPFRPPAAEPALRRVMG
jgi:hypothetical protein